MNWRFGKEVMAKDVWGEEKLYAIFLIENDGAT